MMKLHVLSGILLCGFLFLLGSFPLLGASVRLNQLPRFTRPLNAPPASNVQIVGSPPEGAKIDTKVELLPPDMTDPRNRVDEEEIEEAARRILGEEMYRELTRDDLSTEPEEDEEDTDGGALDQPPLTSREHSELEDLLQKAKSLLKEGEPSTQESFRDGKLPRRGQAGEGEEEEEALGAGESMLQKQQTAKSRTAASSKMRQQDVMQAHREIATSGAPTSLVRELEKIDRLMNTEPVVAGVLR